MDDYFVLISANDNYGKRKLSFLIYLMIGAGCIFIPLIWFLTFSIIKKQLKPLDRFQKQIKNINDLNIETPLETKRYSNNEIDLISNEFNFMMSRIRDAYQKQKEFTSHASHELRTPLARISAQLENQILQSPTNSKNIYSSILQDINQLIALVNSLLILSKIDHRNIKNIELTRIDEIIYDSIEAVNKQYPDIKVSFSIEDIKNLDKLLEVNCKQSLMEIAVINLIKNAYQYSDDKTVIIELNEVNGKIALIISNSGPTLSDVEQQKLFQPFMRGENSKQHSGIGLGLRIVHRIITSYGYSISYKAHDQNNIFKIKF